MKLNERLNLVVPIYGDDDAVMAYVHSAPVSREVFEAHYLLLSKTFTAIHGEGLGVIAGPRVSSLIMRELAKSHKDEAGALALMNEIRRLTNVLTRGATGWEIVPFQEAADRKVLSAEDLSEVENAIVFFIVESALFQRRVLKEILTGAASLWGAQITSSNCTDFAASLPTSTATVNTGAIQRAASSLPH